MIGLMQMLGMRPPVGQAAEIEGIVPVLANFSLDLGESLEMAAPEVEAASESLGLWPLVMPLALVPPIPAQVALPQTAPVQAASEVQISAGAALPLRITHAGTEATTPVPPPLPVSGKPGPDMESATLADRDPSAVLVTSGRSLEISLPVTAVAGETTLAPTTKADPVVAPSSLAATAALPDGGGTGAAQDLPARGQAQGPTPPGQQPSAPLSPGDPNRKVAMLLPLPAATAGQSLPDQSPQIAPVFGESPDRNPVQINENVELKPATTDSPHREEGFLISRQAAFALYFQDRAQGTQPRPDESLLPVLPGPPARKGAVLDAPLESHLAQVAEPPEARLQGQTPEPGSVAEGLERTQAPEEPPARTTPDSPPATAESAPDSPTLALPPPDAPSAPAPPQAMAPADPAAPALPFAGDGPVPTGPAASLAAPRESPPPFPRIPAEVVTQQVAQLVVSGASERAEILLSPAELGRLRFEITQRGEAVQVIVMAERPETLDLLRRNGEQLLTDLRAMGFAGSELGFGAWSGGERAAPDPAAFVENEDHFTDIAPPVRTAAAPLRAVGSGLDLRL